MRHDPLLHTSVAMIAFTLLPCALPAFDGTGTLTSQGISRDFIYHAPGATIAEDLPLVLAFHGLGSNMYELQYQSGFDAVADANNFVVVYPMATQIGGDIQWNVWADDVPGHAGVGEPSATDDVIFTDDLIDWFCANHHVDASRIYATGWSNGGNFCYLLALQRPYKIAAFAPTSANLVGDPTYMANLLGAGFTPVAIYHVHGDPDPVVPYPDAVHDPTQWTWPLSAFGAGDCGVAEYTSQNIVPGVDRLTWCDGSDPNGRRVELIRCQGIGHAWGDLPGYGAASAIWEFFSGYAIDPPTFTCSTGVMEADMSAPLRVRTVMLHGVLEFSRPVAPGTMIHLVDATGRTLIDLSGFTGDRLLLPGSARGIYRVEVREGKAKPVVLPVVVL